MLIKYKIIAVEEDGTENDDPTFTPDEETMARSALVKAGLITQEMAGAEAQQKADLFWKIFTDLRDKKRILEEVESRGWVLGWEERKRYDMELALYIPAILFGLAVGLIAVLQLI